MLYTVERFTCCKCKEVIAPSYGIILKGHIYKIHSDTKKRDFYLSSNYKNLETTDEITICIALLELLIIKHT